MSDGKGRGGIQNIVGHEYIDALITAQESLTSREHETLVDCIDEMQDWAAPISENINVASHLSKYATRIKKTALTAIRLCIKYQLYSDIDSVSYEAKKKIILINEKDFFFLG